jgi:hypothetical protein
MGRAPCDNCLTVSNDHLIGTDTLGDACDNCPTVANLASRLERGRGREMLPVRPWTASSSSRPRRSRTRSSRVSERARRRRTNGLQRRMGSPRTGAASTGSAKRIAAYAVRLNMGNKPVIWCRG